MALRSEPLAHSANLHAFLYGPLVLGGRLGAGDLPPDAFIKPGENDYRTDVPPAVPALVAADLATALAHIEPVADAPLTFKTKNLARPHDVTLIPFYQLHRERHVVYWSLFNAAEWDEHSAQRAAALAREQALAARTLDTIVCAEQQLEVSHDYAGEKTDAHFVLGHGWRRARAGGWFDYTLAVDSGAPLDLLCQWWGEDTGHSAELLVDGNPLATVALSSERRVEPIETVHRIPRDQLDGKSHIVLRVRASADTATPRLLQVRVLRSPPPPPEP
jgi:hypothetical protein